MTANPQFWCTETLKVTVSGPMGRSTIAVDKPYARIGSHSRSEVILQGTGIETRCLYLHATAEGVFCVRLLPTQNMCVGSGTWLRPTDVVQIGCYEISAQLQRQVGGTSPPRVALTAWGSASPPLPVCEVFSGDTIRDKRRFRARLNLVGRRRELALQIRGQQVSSCHSALYWDARRLWCIDLLSSNGTLIQDERIDCACLELGQSVRIGEFVLLLKRLSRANTRQSAWRTGDSDDDMLVDDSSETEFNAVASPVAGTNLEPGKAQPNDIDHRLPPAPKGEAAPSPQAPVRAAVDLRHDQERLQQEFTQRSEQLAFQRQQLEEQWRKSTQEIASQVSHLQSESVLLTAQKEEVAKLRAEWEEQCRVLTEDLKSLKEELAQQQALLDEQKSLASCDDATAGVALSGIVKHELLDREELLEASFGSAPEMPVMRSDASTPFRRSSADHGAGKTVIEGSYLVQKENGQTDHSTRRAPFSSTSLHGPAQPIGRRQAAELVPAPPQTTDSESETGAEPPDSRSPTNDVSQTLIVVDATATSTVLASNDTTSRRVAGRRKQADEDRMGAYVTERLVQREEARRFWLRLLWGVAAAVFLLALAISGYIALTAS